MNGRIGNLSDILDDIDNLPKRLSTDEVVQGHGEELLNFVKDSKLCMLNGRFGEKSNKFTYITDKGKSVVDYILVPHDCFARCMDFEILHVNDLLEKYDMMSLVSMVCKPPDHAVLKLLLYARESDGELINRDASNVPVNGGSTDNQFSKRKYFFDNVPEYFMCSDEFVNSLNNTVITQLSCCSNQVELDDIYEDFCKILTNEMDECLRYVDVANRDRNRKINIKQPKPFWNDELSCLWSSMNAAEKKYLSCLGPPPNKASLRQDYVLKRKQFDKTLRYTERQYNMKIVNEIEALSTDCPKEFWKYLKNIGSRKSSNIPMAVYNDEGSLVYELEFVLEKWKVEFSNLLNRPNCDLFDNDFYLSCQMEKSNMLNVNVTDDSGLNEEISVNEFRKVIIKLKNNKTSSIDCIPNEVLKNEKIFSQLHYLINKVFNIGLIPSVWKKALISPIPKCPTKDLRIPMNSRGINLLSCVGKLYTGWINTRVSNFLECHGKYCDEQNGFRKNRSCEDHIFILSTVVRNRIFEGKDTFCAYIDMKKAFNWVDRELLFYVLLKNGINGKIYENIEKLYDSTSACVKLNKYVTDWFSIKSGVRQGDPLSPTLFCIFVNSLIEEIVNMNIGIEIEDRKVAILAFADDIVLIAKNETDLQKMLVTSEQWCNKFRLEVNIDKTKIMHFRPKKKNASNWNFKFNGASLETVKKYKYLGIIFTEHLDFNTAAEVLAGGAGRALSGIISKFRNLKNVGFKTFQKLFFSNVVPVMDYASGIWGNACSSHADKIQNRAIRYYLGVHSKTALLGLEGDVGWNTSKIRHNISMVRFWNRMLLMDENRLTKKVFNWDLNKAHGWSSILKELFEYLDLPHFQEKSTCDLRLVETKLIKRRKVEWSELLVLKPKLRTYLKFKKEITCEKYVHLKNRKRRSFIAQIRFGILPLNIEIGRFRGIKIEDRTCEICKNGLVEDEFHFICICPAYHECRQLLYNSIEYEHFTNMSEDDKFIYIMKEEQCKVSLFIDNAWRIRNSLVYNL